MMQSTIQRLTSRAALIRQSSAAILRYDTSPSLLRKTSATNLFPELDDISTTPGVELYYCSGWQAPCLHYKTDEDEKWTQPPGKVFDRLTNEEKEAAKLPALNGLSLKDQTVWRIVVPGISGLEFVPNSGSGQWDNAPGNGNYRINEPGRYILFNGQVRQILDPPGKPALLEAKEVGTTFVSLLWNPPMINPSLVVAYHIYRDDTLVAKTGEKNFQHKDVGLLGLTTHTYYVTAVNDNGIESFPSERVTVQTGEPGRPSAPEKVLVVSHSTKAIQLEWQPPADNGGSIVSVYAIYRNGKLLDLARASGGVTESYRDTHKVLPGASYVYHIAALHENPQGAPIRQVSQTASPTDSADDKEFTLEQLHRKYAALAAQCQAENEGALSRGVKAEAKAMRCHPRLNDQTTHVILQAFNWTSCKNKNGWYKVLQEKVQQIKDSSITMVWLPPPAQSVSPDGYMPTKWYQLTSNYGEAEDLIKLNNEMIDLGITPMLDLVVNHRCGTRQDDQGQWTLFEDPQWGPWAIVANNYQGYGGNVGSQDTGTQSECAPDIDHTNQQVRQDIIQWIRWLFHTAAFGAVRIDMAPGYSVGYQVEYIESVDSPFAVGEYWNGDPNVLQNYVNYGNGRLAAFDFALYYTLRRCVENNDFSEMSQGGRLPGLVGMAPQKTVTFIDNHDTEHLNFVGLFGGGNGDMVLRGYVFILTHPGTPCVYWNHFSDFGDFMRQKLQALIKLRTAARISSGSGVYIDRAQWSLYAAYISPDRHCHRGGGSLAVKIGSTDWQPEGANWEKKLSGSGIAVWAKPNLVN